MDDLIRRAREALVDVTPGPWKEFIDDSGDQWTGWPLSIDATSIEDKCVVRTGGQWPYEWDTKTSQHEACANARFIAAARDLVPTMADRLEAQEALLREAMAVLTIYAQSGNWRLGGCCDPNSPNFTGVAIARAALKGYSDE